MEQERREDVVPGSTDPADDEATEEKVDEESKESFPASDPPSY